MTKTTDFSSMLDKIQQQNELLSKASIQADANSKNYGNFEAFHSQKSGIDQIVYDQLVASLRGSTVESVLRIQTEMFGWFEAEKWEDLSTRAKELLKHSSDLKALLPDLQAPSSIIAAISQAQSLLQKFISIFTKTPKTGFHFPLSKEEEMMLLQKAEKYKKEAEKRERNEKIIFEKAMHIGYFGVDLEDAVSQLEENAAGNVKQEMIEEMHAQITQMRAINERERVHAEKERKRSADLVDALRTTIAQLQNRGNL